MKKFQTGVDFTNLTLTPPQVPQGPKGSAGPPGTCGTFGGFGAQNAANENFVASNSPDFTTPGMPIEWVTGFTTLYSLGRPESFSVIRWSRVLKDAQKFIRERAAETARLGWSTFEVFGVNRSGTEQRWDGRGLVATLNGRDVIEISRDTAKVSTQQGSTLVFQRERTCLKGEQIALWELQTPNHEITPANQVIGEGRVKSLWMKCA